MKTMSPTTSPVQAFLGKLFMKFLGVMEKVMPYGYEDGTGFHFGAEPPRVGPMARFRTARAVRRSGQHHSHLRILAHADPISRMMPVK